MPQQNMIKLKKRNFIKLKKKIWFQNFWGLINIKKYFWDLIDHRQFFVFRVRNPKFAPETFNFSAILN